MSNNPRGSNYHQAIILLLLALGIPTATLAFPDQVAQNPGQVLFWVLLWEITVFVFGSITKVWQQLENRWISEIANWLDIWTHILFSNYQRQYLQQLVFQHRHFDIKGLTTQGIYALELEEVFVDLSLVPQTRQHKPSDPIESVPAELKKGRHSIWDYLKTNRNLAVTGAPGSGKTTLLKYITLTLAVRRFWQPKKTPYKFPVLLFLRDHADAIRANPGILLTQVIRNSIAGWNISEPSNWFEVQLDKGQCLVMLDGLDEVADLESRTYVGDWVERQIVVYGKNRFIITSRPDGFETNPLSNVNRLEVRLFTSSQIKRFVHNWYLANEIMSAQKKDRGVRSDAQRGAEDLLERLRNTPTLSELAINPLLLTMIATIHRYRSTLPGRRVELFAEICEVFLGKRQQARGMKLELTPIQKQRVLEALAYSMMCKKQRDILLRDAVDIITEPLNRVSSQYSSEDFLKMIENSSGLLVEREHNIYSFAHKTFQEYLAAVYIIKYGLQDNLVDKVRDGWWEETIRLYAAQTDATSIITACLGDGKPQVREFILALDCLEEAAEVQPDLRDKISGMLEQGIEDDDLIWRQNMAEVMLKIHLRRMVRIDEDTYADISFIPFAVYQLFLNERQSAGQLYHPDHWLTNQFQPGLGKMPVVGLRPSDTKAFCDWLTQREQDDWFYRPPFAGEIKPDSDVGHWAVSNDKFELVKKDLVSLLPVDTTARQEIIPMANFARTLDYQLSHSLNLPLDTVLNHVSNLDFETNPKRIQALTQELSTFDNLDNIIQYAYNIAEGVKDNLEFLSKQEQERNQNLKHIRELVQKNEVERKREEEIIRITEQELESERKLINKSKSHPKALNTTEIDRIGELEREVKLKQDMAKERVDNLTSVLHYYLEGTYFKLESDIENILVQINQIHEFLTQAKNLTPEKSYNVFSLSIEIKPMIEKLRNLEIERASKLGSLLDQIFNQPPKPKDGVIRSLARYFAHRLGLDRIRGFEIIRNLLSNSELVSTLDETLKIDWEINNILKAVIKFARTLRSELDAELDLVHNHVRDLTRDLELAVNRTKALDSALNQVLSHAYVLNLDRTLNRDLVSNQPYQEYPLTKHLVRALNRLRSYDRKPLPQKSIDRNLLNQFLRSFVRLCALTIAAELLLQPPEDSQFWTDFLRHNNDSKKREEMSHLINICLNLYVDFTVVEERIQGKLSAFEGLRIIKERKKKEAQANY